MTEATVAHRVTPLMGLTALAPGMAPIMIYANGTPNGDADPWLTAPVGSMHYVCDQSDDKPPLMVKAANDGDSNDWYYLMISASASPCTSVSGSAIFT